MAKKSSMAGLKAVRVVSSVQKNSDLVSNGMRPFVSGGAILLCPWETASDGTIFKCVLSCLCDCDDGAQSLVSFPVY